MKAKNKFREGWIMLLRPFDFAELSKPLQKLTVLYAYSEKPIISMELNEEGKEQIELLSQQAGKYYKRFGEDDDVYDERMAQQYDMIIIEHSTVEVYGGEVVQCYVEGQLCRFYPKEYSVISRETFEHLLVCDEREYKLEIENQSYFEMRSVRQKLFYIQSRGVSKEMAQKMGSEEAKDAVIFRPQMAVLEMFCRPHEIY